MLLFYLVLLQYFLLSFAMNKHSKNLTCGGSSPSFASNIKVIYVN